MHTKYQGTKKNMLPFINIKRQEINVNDGDLFIHIRI